MDAIEALRDGPADRGTSPLTTLQQGPVTPAPEAAAADRERSRQDGGSAERDALRARVLMRPAESQAMPPPAELQIGQVGDVVFGSATMRFVDVRNVEGRLAAERTEFEARLIEVDPDADPVDRRPQLDRETFRMPPYTPGSAVPDDAARRYERGDEHGSSTTAALG